MNLVLLWVAAESSPAVSWRLMFFGMSEFMRNHFPATLRTKMALLFLK